MNKYNLINDNTKMVKQMEESIKCLTIMVVSHKLNEFLSKYI